MLICVYLHKIHLDKNVQKLILLLLYISPIIAYKFKNHIRTWDTNLYNWGKQISAFVSEHLRVILYVPGNVRTGIIHYLI